MIQTAQKKELQAIISSWKGEGQRIAFVPTMGALHAGHLSLVKIAQERSTKTVVSIFVNPAQFAPEEDFDSYPRPERDDLEKLKELGTDLIYLPTTDEIYPAGLDTDIKAGQAATGLESDFRPHFFDGVVNVVSRLFEQVQPDLTVFGEKDFQQLQVIKEMVEELSMPIEILAGPTIRDKEGLALSSRNAYLSEQELQTARQLNKALLETAANLEKGADPANIFAGAEKALLSAGFDKIDYLDIRWNRLLAAAWIGKTRLIDNIPIDRKF